MKKTFAERRAEIEAKKLEIEGFALYCLDGSPRSLDSKAILLMAAYLAHESGIEMPILSSFSKCLPPFEKSDPRWSQPYLSIRELEYLLEILVPTLEKSIKKED